MELLLLQKKADMEVKRSTRDVKHKNPKTKRAKEQKWIYYTDINEKKTDAAVLMSDKLEFKA